MSSVIRLKVTNGDGIHARTAAMLLNVINKYKVQADIKYKDEKVNLKHLIDVIALSINFGSEVEIIIDGDEASLCINELSSVIENNVGEIV